MLFKLFRIHGDKRFRSVCDFEKFARDFVHALIRALRGQNHLYKQLKRRRVIEFALRVRMHFAQYIEYFLIRLGHSAIMPQKT